MMKVWIKVFFASVLFLHTCVGSADRFLDVESFLTVCTKRLNSSHYYEPQKYLNLEYYQADQIVTVYLRDRNGKPKEYKVYDPYHQLMNGQTFEPQDKAEGGTRSVGFYPVDGKRSLCFKQWPEAPNIEFATYELYKTLFPCDRAKMPIPASEVILMNGTFFSISQFMEGKNLETILEKTKKNSKYCEKYSFDLASFQRLALFCLLSNPEDCRPQNCLVQKMQNGQYKFILIDNERNFCKEIIKDSKEKIITRVHCSLFSFRELLTQQINKSILKRNMMKEIRNWEELCNSHSTYLSSLAKLAKDVDNKTELDLFKDRSPIQGLNKKLNKIKELFEEAEIDYFTQGRISLLDVFKETMPELAHIYLDSKDIIPRNSHPVQLALHRIKSIDAGRSGSVAPPSSYVPSRKWKENGKNLQRAENGSFYGEISELTGGKKMILVKAHYRNGTYVREHWRARKRS